MIHDDKTVQQGNLAEEESQHKQQEHTGPTLTAEAGVAEKWKEQFLRLSADFKNYQKRSEKERFDIAERSQIKVIEKILPLLDDLERALKARETIDQNDQIISWLEGFELIEKNLRKIFSDLHIEEIQTEKFDPRYHEAIATVQSASHKSGDIVAVIKKGYKIGEHVIRPAQVSVAA